MLRFFEFFLFRLHLLLHRRKFCLTTKIKLFIALMGRSSFMVLLSLQTSHYCAPLTCRPGIPHNQRTTRCMKLGRQLNSLHRASLALS